jgi:hypothetical protein
MHTTTTKLSTINSNQRASVQIPFVIRSNDCIIKTDQKGDTFVSGLLKWLPAASRM